MALASMTTGNLYQGQEPGADSDPGEQEVRTMGARFRIGPRIPQAVLKKVDMQVGDLVPEDWDQDQVERWNRRGYLVVDGGKARETAQKGATRETRAQADAGELTLDDLERSGSWYVFPDGSKANGQAAAEEKLAELQGG